MINPPSLMDGSVTRGMELLHRHSLIIPYCRTSSYKSHFGLVGKDFLPPEVIENKFIGSFYLSNYFNFHLYLD